MRLLFRTDSGAHIGQGHLSRCMNIAKPFLEEGHEIHFVVRDHKNSGDILDPRIHVHVLSPGVSENFQSEKKVDYSKWLGVSAEKDLLQLQAVFQSVGVVDVFVVDHYALDFSYQEKLKAKLYVAVDDIANRTFFCDLLINQNPNVTVESYRGLLKKPTELLLGPQFAPIDPRVEELRPKQIKLINSVKTVGVFLGGSDPTGETLKIVQAFTMGIFNFRLKILISKNHSDFSLVQSLVKTNKEIELISCVENMGEFWQACDVVIGAVGVSAWERSCLGIPTILAVGAENQKEIADYLVKRGYCFSAGAGEQLKINDWKKLLEGPVQDVKLLQGLQRKSFEICDGLGAQRIFDLIKSKLAAMPN